ncbi:MAG TPA: LytTR family DNA-binding domain-containing protein [Chitinophagaceae bacterium]|nr:LytTR family DNA-binding domain-containing protein [Chitinophagaceae bacterium]
MTILMIEDEPLVAVSLSRLVMDMEPGCTLHGPLATVAESKQWLATHPAPDLILADIQLADGISLDVFTNEKPGCPIIFTTAYNEYAIRAFKVNSIDYLLKPVEKKELELAFHKFHQLQAKFSNDGYLRQMMELFGNFNQSRKYKERFAVHVGRSVMLVPQAELACFVKEEIIYLINHEGKKLITDYRSLDEVEELLNPAEFYRANRQYILQLAFIESFRTDDTGKIQVHMKGLKMEDVVVSKEKAADFKKWFEK